MLVWCLLLVGATPILGTSVASVTEQPKKIGVIIGKRHLLFSPSSFNARPLEVAKVRVGSLNIYKGGLEVDIEAYVSHPLYDPRTDDEKGRTGKDNRDNIALVIVKEDLPIGRDNVEQAILADANFNTEGSASVLTFKYPYDQDVSKTTITIHSKADCESTHPDVDCTRSLWASASDTCDINIGAPVFSGNTLIGIINDVRWCSDNDKTVFVNSIPYFEKWIKRAIKDEETYVTQI